MVPQYLRMSVTERCNLRCLYCRSGSDCPLNAPPELAVEDFGFLVRCAVAEGVRKVRITGGEPLLRDDLEEIVRCVAETPGPIETTLTTNALFLDRRAQALREAGLTRVNISLDTLQPDRFIRITGADRLPDLLRGIEVAARTFEAVKLNTVLLAGINDDEIEPLVRFAGELHVPIRFIERYAADGGSVPSGEFISVHDVKARLERAFGELQPTPGIPLSVAETFTLPQAGTVEVGLIASSSCPPCAVCTKLRFAARGELRGCLYSHGGVDLRPLLFSRDEAGVREAIRETYRRKDRTGPPSFPAVSVPINLVGG